jgi:hypothetical protein
MSSTIPDVHLKDSKVTVAQSIPGGSCLIMPMQFCIIWVVSEEKMITKLARDVWFAALEVQFWRCEREPGKPYRPSLSKFRISDIAKILGVGERQLRDPLQQLADVGIMRITDNGPWFATSLADISVPEMVRVRIKAMFNKLHPNSRDKGISVPRRILRLIVRCGRKTVRLATLLGLLLRIMLEKRTGHYGGYKGCCKAAWIADVFGVGVDRVKTERRNLIREGWFEEESTSPRVQKRFGLWLRLSLRPSESAPKSLETPTESETSAPELEPQNPPKPLKLQPLSNRQLPSEEGILNNQKLPKDNPPWC